MPLARFAAFVLALAVSAPAGGIAAELPRIAYLGSGDTYLRRQFDLAHFTPAGLDDEPEAIVLADADLSAEQLQRIRGLVIAGTGLVVVLGPHADSALRALLDVEGSRQVDAAAIVVAAEGTRAGALAARIPWRSAPQIGRRTIPDDLAASPLVETRTGDPVILETALGRGRVFVLTPWFASTRPTEPESANYQFQTWSYFPWLLHALVSEAAGITPVEYGDWEPAPLPNPAERLALAILFASLLGLTGALFLGVRRYSRRHPEILDDFVARNFGHHDLASEEQSGWDEIGFHRPLGGFLLFFVLALFVGAPLLLGYSILFRNLVFPFPHALGLWQWVKQFFQFLFTFLDFGTSIALVKYFAEYRIHDPRRSMQYIQFYVWWQALSGVAQVALVSGLAVYTLPGTDYAALCYVVLGHALIQLPGFLLLFHHVFSAFQRFDLAQLLTLLVPFVPLPLALGTVTVLRGWGLEHPRFGEAIGSIFGTAASDYLGVLSLFAVGLLMFRSVYGSPRVLFMAHFDRAIAWSSLSFGFRAALSGVAVGLSAMAQTVILAETVDNYAELQGIWGFGWETILLYLAVSLLLFDNTRAAVAEAFNNGKLQLTNYYLTAALRWGFLVAFILWGLLSVYWPWVIAGVYGDQWARTTEYLWLFQIVGVMHILAVLPTPFLQACGRPGLDAVTVWLEHGVLVLLLYFLTPEYQLWGMLYARTGALLFARILPAWWLLRRYVARPRLYPWQTLLVPLATGLTLMLVYRGAGWLVWDGTKTTTLLLVVFGIAIGTPLGFFVSGLYGGWDDANLAETERAAALTRFARPGAMLLQRAARLGSRLSPLHNRFRIDLVDDAARESAELMRERRETARRLLAEAGAGS